MFKRRIYVSEGKINSEGKIAYQNGKNAEAP
jgi:hypothetical protein